jgi:hypothetical protein
LVSSPLLFPELLESLIDRLKLAREYPCLILKHADLWKTTWLLYFFFGFSSFSISPILVRIWSICCWSTEA